MAPDRMLPNLTAAAAFERFFRNHLRRGLHVEPAVVALPVTYLRDLYAPYLTFKALTDPIAAYLSAVDTVSPTRWDIPMRQCRMLHESLMPDTHTATPNDSYLFFTGNFFNVFEGASDDQRITYRERFIAIVQRQTALDEWSELAIGLGVMDHMTNRTLHADILTQVIPAEHQEWLDRLGRLLQLVQENFTTKQ